MPRLFPVIRTLSFSSIVFCCVFLPSAAAPQSCGVKGIALQVLGSGGPELQDKRASSSYLIWEDGQARVLVDAGGGSALRFGESGAQMSQLDVILFSHFHVDHSGDFPVLIKSSWFEDRKRPLPVYGPEGNDFMPSTVEFVYDFFGDKHGAYRYLSELLVPGEEGDYKLQPHNVAGSCEASRGISPQRRYSASGACCPRRISSPCLESRDGRQSDRFQRRYERRGRRSATIGGERGFVCCSQRCARRRHWSGKKSAHAAVGNRANCRRGTRQTAGPVSSHAADSWQGEPDAI